MKQTEATFPSRKNLLKVEISSKALQKSRPKGAALGVDENPSLQLGRFGHVHGHVRPNLAGRDAVRALTVLFMKRCTSFVVQASHDAKI
jgi:hypothetical protein